MSSVAAPILFPYDPNEFWERIRVIIREEIKKTSDTKVTNDCTKVEGMTYKPLLKMAEVCGFFQVSRPTVYDWIKHGKLKPYRIRRSIYFLWDDIQQLLQS
ncbi:helix-turn-helix domain-containing protein [Flavisolibacter ginsenosidimutans]|uniref:Helix-turn-helix domain-containing protein n=1 Tax=Flavisolibacter ginsenosidimutans TaxID=661481 RepID=A0A5B8UJW3_9BACT|nr:helix-turn-helix domain-containing protein [Flavisolibacter ginsenosidimutans]QEC56330.1 helix-turn-helix domain-containing protein [Flavisolibacter ginsenosidimutans]